MNRGLHLAGLALAITLLTACEDKLKSPEENEIDLNSLAVEKYDRASLISSLEAILKWHNSRISPVASKLRPGISREEINALFLNSECRVPDELIELWSWRDGNTGSWSFIWYHKFNSVKEALSQKKELQNIAPERWKPNWLPVFHFEGEWYFVVCEEPSKNHIASPVYKFSLREGELPAYNNITSMLLVQIDWISSGLVSIDSANNWKRVDMQKMLTTYQDHNIGTVFPYYVEM